MQIAHFTNTYHPVVSGVVRSVSAFRQGLTELGHNVFIFAQHAGDHEDTEPFIFRYPAFELPVHNNFPVIIPVSAFIDRLLPPLKLDVVHTHHPFLLGQTAANKAEELKLPLVFTFHTRYRDYSHYVSLNQSMVKEAIDRWLGVFMQQCQHIIVPSESIRESLVNLYGVNDRVTVLPTGIDLAPYANSDGAAIRRKHGWSADDVILISVGRLAQEKNFGLLVAAAARVLRDQPAARLLILGDGEEHESLRRQAQSAGVGDRVHLPGKVPFSEIPDYLAAADLFCFASTTETQGLVTLEAMAAGLPVVAVAATGTSDVITDGQDGLLVENDAAALAAAIGQLLSDEKRRGALAAAARKTAANFGIQHQAQQLTTVYEQAIEDRRAGRFITVDKQKSALFGKWYELLGFEKNPLRKLWVGTEPGVR